MPKLEEAMTLNELSQLGRRYAAPGAHAPTRPHPWLPDAGGPLNVAANMGAAVVDKAADVLRFGGVGKAEEAAQNVPPAHAPLPPAQKVAETAAAPELALPPAGEGEA